MKIRLELMTKEEYREYMKDFILDVSLFQIHQHINRTYMIKNNVMQHLIVMCH